jgi:hypothetical protein
MDLTEVILLKPEFNQLISHHLPGFFEFFKSPFLSSLKIKKNYPGKFSFNKLIPIQGDFLRFPWIKDGVILIDRMIFTLTSYSEISHLIINQDIFIT